MNQTGRKNNVYCGAWNPGNLLHEVHMTEEIIPFWKLGFSVLRGPRVDQQLKPDATIAFSEGTTPVHCEMDEDTEGYEQIGSQMEKYRRRGEYNIWYAPTQTRVEGIMRLGTEWSFYSVCRSNVFIISDGTAIGVQKLVHLFNTRCG